MCPACGVRGELPAHITICPDPERSYIYGSSVDEVVAWMRKKDTDPVLICLIERYLRARGAKSMSDIAPPSLHYRYLLFIKYQDILG